jgi:uncharacterized protein YeeX (DUF496 family)
MIISSFLPISIRIALVFLLLSSFVFSLKSTASNFSILTQNRITVSPTTPIDSLHLTEQKVKDWIETRIAVAKLQKQMQANAADYNDVVKDFFIKRETLLESEGWPVEEFDTAKDRIHAAISAMDISDDLAESRADHEEEIAEINSNEYYSGKQKEEMRNALRNMREQKKELYIEPTKPDWPAVQPYRSVFEQMTQWIAGNTSEMPIIQ